ncbi:TRAP transporter small permease [Reyranella aquatilis]|uniref:TRAP transporter small permease protein n=1 Tax=Reyranella aquatilis TaxID=2035356 RepID=A0ABS8L360_9HYPH|nr:TRAP transporter small permease [Reyranella aquatilis]MCC8432788.1 TRAP transporter small permease [Reyranella aquatilis]
MFNPVAAVTPLARSAAIICGWILMAISFLTVFEIVARRWFGFSLRGVDEISGYVLAITSAGGFCWAFVTRSHMRITLLFPYVPPLARTLLNLLAMLTLASMALFCAWRGWSELAANFESGKPANTPLQTPLWIPQAFWFAGLALFALTTGIAAAHAVGLLFRDRGLLDQLYGPASLEEEVRTEVSQLETRLSEEGPEVRP